MIEVVRQRYSMTPAQIDLVKKSFDALWPFRRRLAEQFYGRFFELAPGPATAIRSGIYSRDEADMDCAL
jgi:hypothetical protein